MKKRNLNMVFAMGIMTSVLAACGTGVPNSTNEPIPAQTVEENTQDTDDTAKDSLSDRELVSEEADIDSSMDIAGDNHTPVSPTKIYANWYMDSDKIWSDELNLVINEEEISSSFMRFWIEINSTGTAFSCYPSGNTDYYEKEAKVAKASGIIEGVNYYIDEIGIVYFYNDELVVSTVLPQEYLEADDYESVLKELYSIEPIDSDNSSYLVCLDSVKMICPSFGVQFVPEIVERAEIVIEKHNPGHSNPVYQVRIKKTYQMSSDRREYLDTHNAQETVDRFVSLYTTNNPDRFKEIEGSENVVLGNCDLIGRGLFYDKEEDENDRNMWEFRTDNTDWYIEADDYGQVGSDVFFSLIGNYK